MLKTLFRRVRMSSKKALTSIHHLTQSTVIRAFLQATSKEFAGLTTAQIMNATLSDSADLLTANNVTYDGHPALNFRFGGGLMLASLSIDNFAPQTFRTFTTNNTDSWTETTWEK